MDLKELNSKLIKKSRLLVYAIAALFLLAAWFLYADKSNITLNLSNAFGFLSFMFISASLAVTPIRVLSPQFPLNATLLFSRRATGVAGFVFAIFHYITQLIINFSADFQVFLGYALGPGGEGLLTGYISFLMLFLLFITSTDFAVRFLGKRWFTLHKLIYLAYPLIIYHVVSIGVDFKSINLFSGSFLVVAIITIVLECARAYRHFSKSPA